MKLGRLAVIPSEIAWNAKIIKVSVDSQNSNTYVSALIGMFIRNLSSRTYTALTPTYIQALRESPKR